MKHWPWLAALLLGSIHLAAADGWRPVQNRMVDGRWAPAYTVLADGKTGLICGGYSFAKGRCVSSADKFDSAHRRFVPCRGRLAVPRNFAAATILPNGTVLVAGGYNTVWGTLDSAEIYQPSTDTFTLIPSRLSSPRELFTATPLTDGRILFVGGFDTSVGQTQSSADIYNPLTQKFSYTASLTQDRFGQAAVRLADGRVLIVGGKHWYVGQPDIPITLAEIYDPATARFHAARGTLNIARDRPTATLLRDGTVLIAGGQGANGDPPEAEIFHPDTEMFTLLPARLNTPRMAHEANVLPDGRVLLTGGWSAPITATTAATECYDPASQLFVPGPSLTESGHDQALLVFPSGLALVAGGKQVVGGREKSVISGSTYQPVKMQTP